MLGEKQFRHISLGSGSGADDRSGGATQIQQSQRILDGEVGMIVNTPSGSDARADGYAIRAAGTSMNAPILTTVQELAAAVQAIEASMHGSYAVKSLQEHARDLDMYGTR